MHTLHRTGLSCLAFMVICLFAVSCKSKKVLADGSIDGNVSAKSVIKAHYQNQIDFKTLRGKMKIDYTDGEAKQGVTVSFRIKKDDAIWMSAPFGMVKAYITPQRVSFYNKLENEFFDGDFSYLSNLLGTELDFEKVQNLLLGQAIFDLRESKYDLEVGQGTYRLTPKKSLALFRTLFELEPKNYKMDTQELSQPLKNRWLRINYTGYQKIEDWVVPNTVLITAMEEETKNTIDIEYRNLEFDQQISFPYKIPKGYKEIVLN